MFGCRILFPYGAKEKRIYFAAARELLCARPSLFPHFYLWADRILRQLRQCVFHRERDKFRGEASGRKSTASSGLGDGGMG